MLNTKLLHLLLFAFLSFNIFAQDTVKFENALLWEIAGNGLDQKSYIFGTIHFVPEEDFFFTDVMMQRFKECEILALEIDINMSIIEQVKLAKKTLLPDNKTLADYMEPNDYKAFSDYILDTLKISEFTWNSMTKMKPILSSTLILNELIPKSKTYEVEFNKTAKKNKMSVIGLETIESQIDVLNEISIEEQVEMLTNENMDKDPLEEFMKIVKLHKMQDINGMLELLYNDSSMLEYEEGLLTRRNENWIPIIESQIKKKPVFIAVGAMHLSGEFGVLNLLLKKGYTLTPLNIFD